MKGNPLTNIGNDLFPWTIEAELVNCSNSQANLLYQNKANVNSNGTAIFTQLGISAYSDSCRLRFSIMVPVGVNS